MPPRDRVYRDNGDAVRLLGEHGAISPELAARLRRAVGLRNVLVHDYVAVDDRVVLDRLADPSDLTDFVSTILRWLSGAAESAGDTSA